MSDEKTESVDAKIAEAKSLEGIKAKAANEEGMKILENEAKNGETSEVSSFPSFFVEPEQIHKLEFDILFNKKTGAILSISKKSLGIDFTQFSDYGHSVEYFEFTQPSYEQLSNYRQRCSVYNQQAKQIIIEGVQLRSFLLVWHLKNWSLKDKAGNPIELKHDKDGSLSDDSTKKVYSVFPTLVDVVMTSYEKEIMLTS